MDMGRGSSVPQVILTLIVRMITVWLLGDDYLDFEEMIILITRAAGLFWSCCLNPTSTSLTGGSGQFKCSNSRARFSWQCWRWCNDDDDKMMNGDDDNNGNGNDLQIDLYWNFKLILTECQWDKISWGEVFPNKMLDFSLVTMMLLMSRWWCLSFWSPPTLPSALILSLSRPHSGLTPSRICLFAHTLCGRKGLNTHSVWVRKSLNTHCLQLTTSSCRENGGAYREYVFGGKWMVSKGKMIQITCSV